ncbi:MAG: valine--tRNA ligase [Elusimicrobia bacterium]|nr:valine--tRNA ligase [Elusimicrobiota bacterium]
MLDKVYQPREVEARWTAAWKAAGVAHAEAGADPRSRYVIVIPPPNVTGALHIGHALNNTLQDVLVRHHRLRGRQTCWVPGTDHGGIATQNVMEKQLKAEGRTRHDIDRGEFLKRMQAWTAECKSTIMGQLERLGCLLDMGREAFTMDDVRARSVLHAFQEFAKSGLIYRGERMVNWCVRCGTALSDIEVEYEEQKGRLWHFRYQCPEGGGIVVATTRPETMLGDTAVAVHPDDARYKSLVGRALRHPFLGRAMRIVADTYVDPAFGTGAVKVTPGHDPNDFEIWQRHKGEMEGPIRVIDFHGKMTPEAGDGFAGLSRDQARKLVVERLEAEKLLVRTEEHRHSVGVCYRCQQPIEPLLSCQWFMKMRPLAEKALKASEDGRFKLSPASWDEPYRNWLKNIRDWCLSRQIWWGHRIPVWYCLKCNGLSAGEPAMSQSAWRDSKREMRYEVGAQMPAKCGGCGSAEFVQDPDVLDTWFSSALWPLSVFGWPERTRDLKFFYPTTVLVTGYEILHLWVARMQMMGLWFEGKVPFEDCVIHGIVRDRHGKKMSKSLGNVVDPLLMMDKHGTDAFRFSLAMQAYPGKDIPYSEDSLKGPRNFANKIWNSTRFVLMNLPERPPEGGYRLDRLDKSRLELADRWILADFQAMSARFEERMAAYEFAAAADEVYAFLWDEFCDWYVELAKPRLAGEDADMVRTILVQALVGTLKLLHCFMPYITEELYQALKAYAGEDAPLLLLSKPPSLREWAAPDAVERMRAVKDIVTALRTVRSQFNVPPGLQIAAFYSAKDASARSLVADNLSYILHLSRLSSLEASEKRPPHSVTTAVGDLVFYVSLEGIDIEDEKIRLKKEIGRLSEEIRRCDERLSDKTFMDRAPQAEALKLRERCRQAAAKKAALLDILKSLEDG